MSRSISFLMISIVLILINSCSNTIKQNADKKNSAVNKIMQQEDGCISLKIDKAECYSDMQNPASNTAEWDVIVSKTGRYNVWMSSATKDTTDLQYKNSVMLSVHDNRLEARPACDRVIQNSADVALPYFRADSFMGSLFIQDTGLCNIQLINEKILPKNYNNESSAAENSKLLSVFLTPATR
jgi:hypothetical protein